MPDGIRTPLSRTEFAQATDTRLPDNMAGAITPEDVRFVLDGLADSVLWHDETSTGPRGPSAFEVAVAEGFTGTATEWLASLVGSAGMSGTPGRDGYAVAGAKVVTGPTVTLSLLDEAMLLEHASDAAVNVVLPADEAVGFRIGAVVHLLQSGLGAVHIAGAEGVRVEIAEHLLPQTRMRLGAISALKIGPNRWWLHGDLALAPNAIVMPNGGALAGVIQTAATEITLGATHSGQLIETTSDALVTVTVPNDPAIPVGAVIRVAQAGAGAVTFVAGAGATLLQCGSKAPYSSGRHGVVELLQSGPAIWRCAGDLALLKAFA